MDGWMDAGDMISSRCDYMTWRGKMLRGEVAVSNKAAVILWILA